MPVLRLAERQRRFATALLDPSQAVPSALVGPDGVAGHDRFGVYRANVMVGLTEALRDAFPAVERIVGEDFFKAMAAAFAAGHPPHSPVMLDYGEGFAAFIETFAPAADLLYLADVARIERAWVEAYHAPDTAAITPQSLSDLDPAQFGTCVFTLHPSLRLVRSPWPALTIWRMNGEDGEPAPVDLASGGENALVIRCGATVEVRALAAGDAALVEAFAKGHSIDEAAQAAFVVDAAFDLAAALSALFALGAFGEARGARVA
jgi:hypothetical protein